MGLLKKLFCKPSLEVTDNSKPIDKCEGAVCAWEHNGRLYKKKEDMELVKERERVARREKGLRDMVKAFVFNSSFTANNYHTGYHGMNREVEEAREAIVKDITNSVIRDPQRLADLSIAIKKHKEIYDR